MHSFIHKYTKYPYLIFHNLMHCLSLTGCRCVTNLYWDFILFSCSLLREALEAIGFGGAAAAFGPAAVLRVAALDGAAAGSLCGMFSLSFFFNNCFDGHGLAFADVFGALEHRRGASSAGILDLMEASLCFRYTFTKWTSSSDFTWVLIMDLRLWERGEPLSKSTRDRGYWAFFVFGVVSGVLFNFAIKSMFLVRLRPPPGCGEEDPLALLDFTVFSKDISLGA